MELLWLDRARREVHHIRDHIAADNPRAARQVALHLHEASELLREAPHMGRPGRIPGTRELVVVGTPFIILYRARAGMVEILRVIHGARKWPESL